jgi:hypothetical protein
MLGPAVGVALGATLVLAACGASDGMPDGAGSGGGTSDGGASGGTSSGGEGSSGAGTGGATSTSILPTDTQADYQLGGSYDPPAGVGIVARDSSEYPAEGLYSICYVNGFQSQPQDADFWLEEHPDLLLRYPSSADGTSGTDGSDGADGASSDGTDSDGAKAGEPVIDANWPDEMIFDTSTEAKRAGIADVIGETIAQCAERGFDAVEFDNLDSWSRTSGALTLDDSIALAELLVGRSSELGLASGQKNSAELGTRGRDEAGFVFAVSEECAAFDECSAYTDVYGDNVIDIEYTDEVDVDFDELCADPERIPLTILRDRNLVTPNDPDYVYEAC